jgi:asparagine synthase (glutamine-hydrolysing)
LTASVTRSFCNLTILCDEGCSRRGAIAMCGITGLISGRTGTPDLIKRLTVPLAHRGPDDGGSWIDTHSGVAFGHCRLSIVDLSPQGHQPMISADERWVITYNGEIYNHQELRAELDQAQLTPEGGWRGHSDTETLLQAIASWGLDRALSRATGMFAFGLWNRNDRKLYLVRDRFGEKPLYYGWVGGDFVFASELKALTAHPRFDNHVSREALAALTSQGYVPAPLSIYRRLFKLPPAAILEVSSTAPASPLDEYPDDGVESGVLKLRRYWSYADVVTQGLRDPISDEQDAIAELERALVQSIKGQAMADVPVGAFLSGGIDSSTVVALYQKHSSVPVRSFTIGFEHGDFNEAEYARAIAQRLGTVHHERYVTACEAAAVIPLLPSMFDEPFGDSSAIPTYLVSQFAREQVKVALSGDGGDELFAGYRRYRQVLSVWRNIRHIPLAARRVGATAAGRIPFQFWSGMDRLLGVSERNPLSGKVAKALKLGGSVRSFDDLYAGYLDQWPMDGPPVVNAQPRNFAFPSVDAPDGVRMTYRDAVDYLPDDILCKVDRSSMAVSLECRVPFLDHRVAQVAARIPVAMKLRGKTGKWILRELLGRHLPAALFDRPKSGFSLPIREWLSGDLRDWAEDLLDPSRMRQEGFFQADRVQGHWRDYLSKRRNSSNSVWAILMFQSWLRSHGTPAGAAEIQHYAA